GAALSEIEGQRAQMAELAKQRDDREAMRDEIAALWNTLLQAEQEAQQGEAAAATLQAEVEALRETLAKTEAETQQRTAAGRRLQAEVATLRGRLAQAEGEATERRATAAALEAQVATLQDTLTAAREVGKAGVAAFRLDIAAPALGDARRGWLQAVMKF